LPEAAVAVVGVLKPHHLQEAWVEVVPEELQAAAQLALRAPVAQIPAVAEVELDMVPRLSVELVVLALL
jgi:hypothetical protein